MSIHYPIETPRLQLVPFTVEDEEALYILESDADVKRFTGGVLTRAETKHLLQSFMPQVEQSGLGAIAIKQKESKQIIGLCGLWQDTHDGELFFGLARRAWNQGFATEACQGLLKAGFQELNLQRIHAVVHPENKRSIRVLERLGMRLLHTLMNAATSPEELTYELGIQEWHPAW